MANEEINTLIRNYYIGEIRRTTSVRIQAIDGKSTAIRYLRYSEIERKFGIVKKTTLDKVKFLVYMNPIFDHILDINPEKDCEYLVRKYIKKFPSSILEENKLPTKGSFFVKQETLFNISERIQRLKLSDEEKEMLNNRTISSDEKIRQLYKKKFKYYGKY